MGNACGSKWVRVCEAIVLAMAHKKPSRTLQSWADEFQLSKTYVHRIAQNLGYEDFFATPEKKTTDVTVNMRYHSPSKEYKDRTLKPLAEIPTSLLRGAALSTQKKLRMRVASPGQILVEAHPV